MARKHFPLKQTKGVIMRVDLFVALSEEGSKIAFDRDQKGVQRDSHLAARNLTPSQARKVYEAARAAFNAEEAKYDPK